VLTLFIATHNGAPTLPRVLGAYARLIEPSGGWKLVVVDNASDDDTPTIVRSFADRVPLLLVSEVRRGKNRALNSALHHLEGDLAVFSDDDAMPQHDWLVQLRTTADEHPEYDIFSGRIVASWDAPPAAWILDCVDAAPVYGLTPADRADGPCGPTKVWGPNMAVRADWFRKGYRFDPRLGPNGSARYSMGGETELTLRLAIAEQALCWHSNAARVQHIIRLRQLSRPWILRRAFNLGRCLRRESMQSAAAGRPFVPRGATAIGAALARGVVDVAAAYRRADARLQFTARWNLSLWSGCLYEALGSRYNPPGRHDANS